MYPNCSLVRMNCEIVHVGSKIYTLLCRNRRFVHFGMYGNGSRNEKMSRFGVCRTRDQKTSFFHLGVQEEGGVGVVVGDEEEGGGAIVHWDEEGVCVEVGVGNSEVGMEKGVGYCVTGDQVTEMPLFSITYVCSFSAEYLFEGCQEMLGRSRWFRDWKQSRYSNTVSLDLKMAASFICDVLHFFHLYIYK